LNWSLVPLAAPLPVTTGTTSSVTSIRAIRASSTNSYVWAITSRQIETSGDGGKTWISHALPFEPRRSLHFHPTDDSNFVLAGDHGVFISRDSGESWHQANFSELLIEDMTPVKNAIVVSTEKGSLYFSRDAGRTWGHLESPNADSALSALRSRETGNQLVVASATEGLFVLDLGSAASASFDTAGTSTSPKQ
jgi:photosystem II stability/assembly factor-like uncharacterized protein